MTTSLDDVRLMQLALAQAATARGRTSPNPMVGCVIARNGKPIASGYHHRAGRPHAEIEALQAAASIDLVGCTAYVTLEPCNHQGRTPPCTRALIDAGLARIVVAMADPNPTVTGGGIKRLRAAGMTVDVGVCQHEAERLNEAWLHRLRTGRPLMVAKIAQSLDGSVATARGQSRWISSPESRQEGHRLRDSLDAIMVGAGTVRIDNPRLTSRIPDGRDPLRIVVSSDADLPLASKVWGPDCVLATTRKSSRQRRAELAARGVTVLLCRSLRGQVDLAQLLEQLPPLGIDSVLVEGGSGLLGTMFDRRLVDKLVLFLAPLLLGGASLRGIGGRGPATLAAAPRLDISQTVQLGPDLMVVGYPRYPGSS